MSDMSEIEDNRAELSGEMKKLQLRNSKELKQLMTYYNCAMLEIETKFRVLSQEFSLEQDYNPIETIKSRLKSMDSIVEKLQRKNLPDRKSVV